MVVAHDSTVISIHADIIEAGDGETTILAGAYKENLLPTHKNVSRIREVNIVTSIPPHTKAHRCEGAELLPMIDIGLDLSVPSTSPKKVISIIYNLAFPKCDDR